MERQKIIAGNWKMHKTAHEAVEFIHKLAPTLTRTSAKVFLAAPFTTLQAAVSAAAGMHIWIGAQNMHDASEGAFTGEISARMLRDIGVHFVILGHSERRSLFHETNEWINRKVRRALAEDLVPLLCIGETLEQREEGKTEEVLCRQLEECLHAVSQEEMKRVIIAYEPVWAIGTGKAATAEIAEDTHKACRAFIAKKWGHELAHHTSLLYGGSVKPETSAALLSKPNIDGLLIGGAALDVATFSRIIEEKQ